MVGIMSMGGIREYIAREEALDRELLSHFLDFDTGQVTLKYESEYWDYKRQLFDLEDPNQVAELAADVLAFHNARGGYLIYGITDDYVVLGLHSDQAARIQSSILNAKLKKYIGESFRCQYAPLEYSIGGTRKTLAAVFVPPRKGIAVRTCSAAPRQSAFKAGEILFRAGDTRKRPQTDADFLFVNSPPEPEMTAGSPTLRITHPRPGFRLFQGDYGTTGFIGDTTRLPLVNRVIDELLYDKWDVVLLRGVGGVGKTAIGTEATLRLECHPEYKSVFGGIICLSAKIQELTPYALLSRKPEIGSFDEFLSLILANMNWDGDIPRSLAEKEALAKKLIKNNNILLFIDNYETIDVRESRIAKFIRELPTGAKTLITSRHQPVTIPAMDIFVDPLDEREAEHLAIAEAGVQHVEAYIIERYLREILTVSERLPLAIKWIIGCSKNAQHLRQLIEDHRHGRPSTENLCEFCFTFEYNLLSETAKKALVLFPVFRHPPSARELAVALDVDVQTTNAALDELTEFSLAVREGSPTRDEEIFRILRLTASFASTRLLDFPELDRQARRRLKAFYGASIPALLDAAQDMVARGVTAPARQYIDEEILEREPNNARALYLKGQTYEKDLQETLARAEYEKALSNATQNGSLIADISLRLAALAKNEPERSREELLPKLESAYGNSSDNRVAVEIARIYVMIHKPERAHEYYSKIYEKYHSGEEQIWEEAVLFLCQELRTEGRAKAALDLIRRAEKACPTSKTLLKIERTLLDETGQVRWVRKLG
jgi:Tfp pilus assembly protein PilF